MNGSAIRELGSNNKICILLSVLIGSGYLSVYLNHFEITALMGWAIVVLCYYILLYYNSLAPVILLICSNKILCGFLIGPSGFSLSSILVNYLPLFIYFTRNFTTANLNKNIIAYKYTFLYFWGVLFCFLINFSVAAPLLVKHVFPYCLILLYLLFIPASKSSISFKVLQNYFRCILFVSIVVFFLPGHVETEGILLTNGYLFGQTTEDTGFALMDALRNVGIFFDPRVTGLFACLYFYVIVKSINRISIFDLLLIVVVVVTSISRGAMMILILLILFYKRMSVKQIIGLSFLILVIVLTITYFYKNIETVNTILMTLDLTSEDNVLSQRSMFKDYSLSYFYSNPIFGAGFGELNAPGISRNISSEVDTDVVTDAYLYAKLGEMGLFGTILFSLSFIEMIKEKRIRISYGLLIGLFLQMLGTDTPNMGFLYFVMIILVCNKTKYAV